MTLKDVLTLTESSQKIILVHDCEEIATSHKEIADNFRKTLNDDILYKIVDAIETSTDGGVQYLVIGLK